MIQADPKIFGQARFLGRATQMPLRRPTIESLEQRCPLDAAGLDNEPIVPVATEPIAAPGAAPAITCYPDEVLRSSPDTSVDRGHETVEQDRSSSQVGLVQPPAAPNDPSAPSGGAPVMVGPELPVTELVSPANEPDPLLKNESDPLPNPTRFAAPQQPVETIAIVPQPNVMGSAVAIAATGSKLNRTAQHQFTDNDDGRLRLQQRSEVSLSSTRYFEPAEEGIAAFAVNLHDDTTSLRSFQRFANSGESGIAIGYGASPTANNDRLAQRQSRSLWAEAKVEYQHQAELDEARDLAIVALVSVTEAEQAAPIVATQYTHIEQNLAMRREASDAGESVGGADEKNEAAVPASWLTGDGLVSSLSRLALVGLLLSNRDVYMPLFSVGASPWSMLLRRSARSKTVRCKHLK